MNIFVTHPYPHRCAMALDDKRVVKMTLETAQLISNAIYHYNGCSFYKPTHLNHPCSKWVRRNSHNYNWTLMHFISLLSEYKKRFNRVHKCSEHFEYMVDQYKKVPKGDFHGFFNCTPNQDLDAITAYRKYLMKKWTNDKITPKWTNSKPPLWSKL